MSKLIPTVVDVTAFQYLRLSRCFTLAYLLLSINHFQHCEFSLCYSNVMKNRMNIIQGCVFRRGSR